MFRATPISKKGTVFHVIVAIVLLLIDTKLTLKPTKCGASFVQFLTWKSYGYPPILSSRLGPTLVSARNFSLVPTLTFAK